MANPKDLKEIIPSLDEIIQRTELMAKSMENVNKSYEKFGQDVVKTSKKVQKQNEKLTGSTEEERKQLEENAKAAQKLKKAHEDYTKAMSDNERQIANIKQTQREFIKQRQLEEKVAKSSSGSYDQLSAKYSLLKRQLNALSKEERNNTKEGKAMVMQANSIRNEMNGLQKETGNYSLQVGKYTAAFDSLPGPLRGITMGFKSITKAAIAFIATPIGAVLAALVAVIGALKVAFTSSEEGQNKFARIMAIINTIVGNLLDVVADLGEKLIWAAEHPRKAWQGFKDFIQGIGEFFQNTFGNIIVGSVQVAVRSVSVQFGKLNVLWQQLKNKFTDNSAGIIEAQNELIIKTEELTEAQERVSEGANNLGNSVKNAYDKSTEALTKFIEQNMREAKLAGQVADMRAKADIIERDLIVERARLESKIAELRLKAREEDRFTAEERKQFLIEARDLQDGLLQKENEVLVLRRDAQKLENTFSRTNKENKMKEAQAIADVSRKEAERYNQARQIQRELNTINKQALAERNKLNKGLYDNELKALDQTNELNILRAKNAGKNAEKIKEIEIQAKINRYNLELELAKKFGKEISETEIQIIQEKIKSLQNELERSDSGDGKKTIWDKLGLGKEGLQKVKDNLKTAVNEVKKIFQDFAETRIEQADLIVEQSQREVDAAENEYNRQIELQQAGYANNVTEAQRNLELARETEKTALDEKKKAQKAKQQIDTAEQISSIIVASANILKGWSNIPFIGQALGIAAIAAMIGSFALTKTKIRSQAKEQFAEGDYIDLKGGSHASGNDIPFGYRKGKVMTAEGGEGMAIFNKRAKYKYGKLIPGLVADINKGRLEERYKNSFSIEIPEKDLNDSGFDSQELRDIKRVLEMIYSQGSDSMLFDKKGRKIQKKGNITRIIN